MTVIKLDTGEDENDQHWATLVAVFKKELRYVDDEVLTRKILSELHERWTRWMKIILPLDATRQVTIPSPASDQHEEVARAAIEAYSADLKAEAYQAFSRAMLQEFYEIGESHGLEIVKRSDL